MILSGLCELDDGLLISLSVPGFDCDVMMGENVFAIEAGSSPCLYRSQLSVMSLATFSLPAMIVPCLW